jgi:hypothetical protein
VITARGHASKEATLPTHHLATEPARHYQVPPTRRLRYAATAVAWLLVLVAAVTALLVLETAGTRIP